MMNFETKLILGIPVLTLALAACREVRDVVPEPVASFTPEPTPSETPPAPAPIVAARYLYISSGACYGGGATVDAASASRTVSRWHLSTGSFDRKIVDYALNPGDQPVGLLDANSDSLLVLIENTGARRIDRVFKDGSGFQSFFASSTVLSAVVTGFARALDGGIVISRTTGIEKISSVNTRVGAPFINAPAAPCATSTTAMRTVAVLPNGMIAYGHSAASPNNRIGVISQNGYLVAADCKAGLTGPMATALPSSMVFHPTSNRLFVAYGSATLSSNVIYSYAVDQNTGTLSDATEAYYNPTIVNGPTAMAVDPETGDVYIAVGYTGVNAVEKFQVNSNGKTLTRVGSAPFILPSSETRCPSSILVAD